MGDHYSWRTGFYSLGVVGILVALILLAFLRDNPATTAERRAQGAEEISPERFDRKVLAILKTPTAVCVVLLAFALSLTSWPTAAWVPTYLYGTFNEITPNHASSTVRSRGHVQAAVSLTSETSARI